MDQTMVSTTTELAAVKPSDASFTPGRGKRTRWSGAQSAPPRPTAAFNVASVPQPGHSENNIFCDFEMETLAVNPVSMPFNQNFNSAAPSFPPAACFVAGPTSAPALQQLQCLMQDADFSDMDADSDEKPNVEVMKEDEINWYVPVAATPPPQQHCKFGGFSPASTVFVNTLEWVPSNTVDETMGDEPFNGVDGGMVEEESGVGTHLHMGGERSIEGEDSEPEEGEIVEPTSAKVSPISVSRKPTVIKLGFKAEDRSMGPVVASLPTSTPASQAMLVALPRR